MQKLRKSGMVVLLGALLIVIMAGVVGARPNDGPQGTETEAIVKSLIIPGAAFDPAYHEYKFDNWGYFIMSKDDGSWAYFVAPVVFPLSGKVTVTKIQIIGYDKNGGAEMCAVLYRTRPLAAEENEMARICTGKSFAWDRDPKTWTDASINNNPINVKSNGAYIWLGISDDTNLRLYAVKIYYRKGV